MRVLNIVAACVCIAGGGQSLADSPMPVPLWQAAPGEVGDQVRINEYGEHVVTHVQVPSITPYLPDAAHQSGIGVLVIPGGGHREIWMDHEGSRVASFLRDHGIAAFVLKYRLAQEPGSTYTVEGDELSDVRRALQFIRDRKSAYGIQPARVGVLGFSAGGELAALSGLSKAPPGTGVPPAFMGLLYPAMPRNLHIGADAPPAFIVCGQRDSPPMVNAALSLFTLLNQNNDSVELHMIANVGHGFGIRDRNPPSVAIWPTLLIDWLHDSVFREADSP
jgi:endo-1,4-beta-xylanase